jgi:hypothetical protein
LHAIHIAVIKDEFAHAFSDDKSSIASRSEYRDLINQEDLFSDAENLEEEFLRPPPRSRLDDAVEGSYNALRVHF